MTEHVPKKQTSHYHELNNASEEEINSHIQSYMAPAIEKSMFRAPSKIYDLWIGKHINQKKSTVIRREMKKPVSKLDKDGFIYVYSIPNGPRASQNSHAYFKIGRTNNPHRRMYQVSNVCKLDPKIIEIFPSFPIDDNQKTLSTNLATLKNTLAEIPKCPLSHRVEKLIHLELSSLYKRAGFKCPHCGKTHREWIRINRRKGPDGAPMTDRELWVSCIRPVILKWIKYGVLASVVNRQ
ncbi:hypothetical protein MFLAVUS_008177 [Mucor flavus]|uniref:Bacteriophage T5 Orf172 DNA-binding domain-containing protein n=1 Tax=Mucor flavus TaxID=439312 RepID=A0ABP9Z6C6_9FUNG